MKQGFFTSDKKILDFARDFLGRAGGRTTLENLRRGFTERFRFSPIVEADERFLQNAKERDLEFYLINLDPNDVVTGFRPA